MEEQKQKMQSLREKESIQDVFNNIEKFERDIVMNQFKPDIESTKMASLDTIKERTARMRKALGDEINTIYKIEETRRENE